MDLLSDYRSKLRTAEEAVKIVKDGDWVDYGSNNSYPPALDAALAARRDELHSVKVRGNFLRGPLEVVECDPEGDHFIYNTWHCSSYDRRLCDRGRAFFTPMTFRNMDWYYRSFLTTDVAMVSVATMDDEGNFNLSGALGSTCSVVENARYVIVEVNPAMPHIRGEAAKLPLEKVDAIVEGPAVPLWELENHAPNEIEKKIASYVFPYIHDGATIQLGIGGVPNAIGELIGDSDLKDLGMHTELASDGYLAMYRAGKLTNRRKSLYPGIGVLGLAIGSREFYSWLDDNPEILGMRLDYVNSIPVIAQNNDMISINGCLAVDLYGQACSESIGTRPEGSWISSTAQRRQREGSPSFACLPALRTGQVSSIHASCRNSVGIS